MLYTSIDNKKIKEYKKLQMKKYRDKTGLFIVEGSHLVLEAYKTGYLKVLLLDQDENFTLPVETHYMSKSVTSYLSTLETPSTVFGICQKKEQLKKKTNRMLLLDNIQDPGNLGTIIRSAVAFHFDTILLGTDCVDIYSSKVIRASQGMIFYTNIFIINLLESVPRLKEQGYQILVTNVVTGKSLKTLEKNDKFAIIMGNEGQGVKQELLDLSDSHLYIDMNPDCESLNVGVAASIIMYELDK